MAGWMLITVEISTLKKITVTTIPNQIIKWKVTGLFPSRDRKKLSYFHTVEFTISQAFTICWLGYVVDRSNSAFTLDKFPVGGYWPSRRSEQWHWNVAIFSPVADYATCFWLVENPVGWHEHTLWFYWSFLDVYFNIIMVFKRQLV